MRKTIIAIMVLASLAGVSREADGATKMERDLEEMKRRLEAVEQATVGKSSNRMTAIEERQEAAIRAQAEQLAEIDALRVELQRLRGQYDDLQHSWQELHDLIGMMRSEMELKINAIEERLKRLENRPAATPSPPAPAAALNPVAEYEAALKLIQQDGEFTHGRKGLQAFLKKHPDHELAVNAVYWIGEAYYGEQQYENAILQFQDVLQKHPQHPKAAAAQLKQALAFQALGDVETTRVLLKKTVQNYPGTPEAKKAGERLETLK